MEERRCHAAEGPPVVAVAAARRPYTTGIEVQVVSLRSRNSSTRPVVGVPSKVVKRGAVHVAGTDKVVRISINERRAIKSVGSIGRAAKVCAGGDNEGVANGTDTGSGDPINVGYQTNGWYKLSTHPLYFTRAGYLWSDEYRSTTTNLLYWSATSRSSSSAYSLYAHSGELYPAFRRNRADGHSVRCVTSYVPICHLQILWLAYDSPSSPPVQTLAALPILPTLLMAIRSLILILTTLSVPAAWTAPRFTTFLGTHTTGLVLLFRLRGLTPCTSIPVLYTRRAATTATTDGPSAAW